MKHLLLAGIAFLALSVPASAHVSLETGMASWGSYYKAVFRVPHGCEGSATTGVSIEIPEGVISVKPMPKPGWTVKTVTGKYAAPSRATRARERSSATATSSRSARAMGAPPSPQSSS